MELGVTRQTRELAMEDRPHLEPLWQDVRSTIKLPGRRGFSYVEVDLLLDSGSEVPAVSEELVVKIQREQPNMELICPFEGRARLVTAFAQQKDINT